MLFKLYKRKEILRLAVTNVKIKN